MFFSILHRTIFYELARIFLMSLVAITGILVMAGLIAEATQQGLGPSQVLVVIPLLIPSTLPYTIPTTTLFATCLVYGRLAHDNEILAIKSAGVNILYVIWPGVALGVLMSAFTMVLYLDVIPSTHRMLRAQVLKDVEEYLYTMLRRDNQIKQPGMNYAIFVRQLQGRRLVDAVFKRQDNKGQYDVIATAHEAYLQVSTEQDPETHAEKRVLHVHMIHCKVFGNDQKKDNRGSLDEQDWPVDLSKDFFPNHKSRPRAMTWEELQEQRQELLDEIHARTAALATELAKRLLAAPPVDLNRHVENLQNIIKHRGLELRCVLTEIHMRMALSFGCLFFVLIGCPVGIWFSRSDYLSAFITCFLPIVFIYYPMILCTSNLAKDGKLPAVVALWMANGLMALIAPFLFWNLMKN